MKLNFWVNCVKNELSYEPLLGIVGNKIDLYENEKVNQKYGQDYANKIGALFPETSAKENPDRFRIFVKELVGKLLSTKKYILKTSEIFL